MRNLADTHRLGKLPKLILMTDDARMPDPLPAARALPRGCAVIFRHYNAPDRTRLARALIAVCRPRHIRVLIAGDAELALSVNADGLHVPDALLTGPASQWRLWRRPGKLFSAAAHSPRALSRAEKAGVDFALLSPVFPTKSHPGIRSIGIHRFRLWAGQVSVPVYALGGVNPQNAHAVLRAGATGWAGIEGLSPGENPTS